MKVVRHTDADFEKSLDEIASGSSLFDPEIEERTRRIVMSVKERGDEAVLEFTERFNGVTLTAERLAISQAEIMSACLTADEALREAVEDADRNIAGFAQRSKRRGWSRRNSHGAMSGEKFDPFDRVGIYIPGGAAPLISTALMTITLARVAGCPEIVVCTPCAADGSVNAALLFAARKAGATEIYRLGGAQAIAAMAFGTKTIGRVQKIFGPGNAYVVAAKRLVYGYVAIDLLPGPSEVLVLADETANPRLAAADLLAQAEHGSGHERVWLVTTSAKILQAVQKECGAQIKKLPRRKLIEQVLANNGWLIQANSMEQAVDLVNRIAPEHCEVMTRNPEFISRQIKTAGALFVGPWSPTATGDYVAGPSHTLPTGGAAASFGGLTVDQFQRRTSVVQYNKASLKKALKSLAALASLEGLSAHQRSAEIRF
jgi:histidinol dehydrogenase